MKIAVLIGTRPEIIKMSPVIKELSNRTIDYFVIHTGQHYSYNMDKVFFEQLKITLPDYNLEVGSDSHAKQTAKILIGIEDILYNERPDIVLVEGDTNSVLACALAATKIGIKVGHVEAGLRSYDKNMPEEINRILTDHCSDYLFAPTDKAKNMLLSEGIAADKIFVTYNTIVDAVYQNLQMAKKDGGILRTLSLTPQKYFLATVHRQENVDNKQRFEDIFESLASIADKYNCPLIYPIHPHSLKMAEEFQVNTRNIKLIDPISYFDFLQLESNSRLILTDSGGVQEEACILGVPCVTLRYNTERPETIEAGSNILAGTLPENIIDCVETMLSKDNRWDNPFGDGEAANRIIDILIRSHNG
ncbi:non-hydrolyzing UDP-N-acetylglucosamine 2-epimerase [Chloroflexota bacterium]